MQLLMSVHRSTLDLEMFKNFLTALSIHFCFTRQALTHTYNNIMILLRSCSLRTRCALSTEKIQFFHHPLSFLTYSLMPHRNDTFYLLCESMWCRALNDDFRLERAPSLCTFMVDSRRACESTRDDAWIETNEAIGIEFSLALTMSNYKTVDIIEIYIVAYRMCAIWTHIAHTAINNNQNEKKERE